jgi:surface polysaccharide O-acyltransferase-like enzyme
MFNLFSNISGFLEFYKGFLNLHTSYLAPFLFLFIVGIICHIKFNRQKGPDFNGALKRFSKLYLSTLLLGLILPLSLEHLAGIDYIKFSLSTLSSNNILMIIAYVYLINEFILHSMIKYYYQKIPLKIIFIAIIILLMMFFNSKTKTIYLTYHELPIYLVVLFGIFTSMLGDLFVCIYNIVNSKNRKIIISCLIFIPIGICTAAAIWIRPTLGSIKEMNIIYFMYCFSLTVILIQILDSEYEYKLFQNIKKLLSLLGRHSLGLYVFHFFIGFAFEKFVFAKFVPKQYWPVNILLVFIACIIFAIFLDRIQLHSRHRSINSDSTI